MIYQNTILGINLGDSRIIASYNFGKKIEQISVDHVPNNLNESMRIFKNNGTLYKQALKSLKIYEACSWE